MPEEGNELKKKKERETLKPNALVTTLSEGRAYS